MSAGDTGLPQPRRVPRKKTFGERWRLMSLPNQLMFGATVVIALATVVNVIVFTLESISGGKQTDKLVAYAETQAKAASDISDAADDFTDSAHWMEEHMNDPANAMQDSVDTASENTKTTIKNAQAAFRADQRAWVGVQEADGKDFSETTPWTVTVVFFNSGKSPARNVQTSAKYKTSHIPLAGPPAEDIENLHFRPAQSIAPQGRYFQLMGGVIPAEPYTPFQMKGFDQLIPEYQSIKTKQLLMYYFGILKYDDVFGNHRETHYCILLANPDTKEAAFCDSFNDLN